MIKTKNRSLPVVVDINESNTDEMKHFVLRHINLNYFLMLCLLMFFGFIVGNVFKEMRKIELILIHLGHNEAEFIVHQ